MITYKKIIKYLKELKQRGKIDLFVFESTITKDRKIGRLRSPGIKEYKNYKIEIKTKTGETLYWDSADTYRTLKGFGGFIDRLKDIGIMIK